MLPRLLVQSLPSLWFSADDGYVAFLSSFVTTAFPCQSLKPLPATSVLERAKGRVWRLQRDLCNGARWERRASFSLLVSGCGQTPGLVSQVLSHLRWDQVFNHFSCSAVGATCSWASVTDIKVSNIYLNLVDPWDWTKKSTLARAAGQSSTGGQEGITRITPRKNKQWKRTWVSIKLRSLK